MKRFLAYKASIVETHFNYVLGDAASDSY